MEKYVFKSVGTLSNETLVECLINTISEHGELGC